VAAAPGEALPEFPLPTHSVNVDLCELMGIGLGEKKFIVPAPSFIDTRPMVEHNVHRAPDCTSGAGW
jgi:hypothetical protein